MTSTRSWKWWLAVTAGVVAVLALVVGTGVLLYLRGRDSATPVSLDESVDRFRSGSTQPSGSGPRSAAEGVYVYATKGSEHVDVLDGTMHTYPDTTTITITAAGCGVNEHWDALAERSDDSLSCAEQSGRVEQSFRTHHEFFGVTDDQEFDCGAGNLLVPSDLRIDSKWNGSCSSASTTTDSQTELVGLETLEIGGEKIEVVHLRIESTNRGASTATTTRDDWRVPDTGLLVRRESENRSETDSVIGKATYVEQFTLELTSLTPTR